MKSIREDDFLKKYGMIVEITKEFVYNSAMKAFIHF
jgi:hypothetical protein